MPETGPKSDIVKVSGWLNKMDINVHRWDLNKTTQLGQCTKAFKVGLLSERI